MLHRRIDSVRLAVNFALVESDVTKREVVALKPFEFGANAP